MVNNTGMKLEPDARGNNHTVIDVIERVMVLYRNHVYWKSQVGNVQVEKEARKSNSR